MAVPSATDSSELSAEGLELGLGFLYEISEPHCGRSLGASTVAWNHCVVPRFETMREKVRALRDSSVFRAIDKQLRSPARPRSVTTVFLFCRNSEESKLRASSLG